MLVLNFVKRINLASIVASLDHAISEGTFISNLLYTYL